MSDLLTVSEVARKLRLSADRVYDLVHAGRLPAIRFATRGKILFDPHAVESALRRASTQPAPTAA